MLSWRLSIALKTDFCIEALKEVLTRFGAPKIFNIDREASSQDSFHRRPAPQEGCDQHGQSRRLARQRVHWAPVALQQNTKRSTCGLYGSVSEVRASVRRSLTFYNGRRPHSSLDCKTPDHGYFNRSLLTAT